MAQKRLWRALASSSEHHQNGAKPSRYQSLPRTCSEQVSLPVAAASLVANNSREYHKSFATRSLQRVIASVSVLWRFKSILTGSLQRTHPSLQR
ncbi:hypothetical protein A2U01_0010496, partial [Trifolium medium]|nr:hypothetical protein [Trifolium medium]